MRMIKARQNVVGVYLPLAGGTMTGNLNINTFDLLCSTARLRQGGADTWLFRDLADTTGATINIASAVIASSIRFGGDGAIIRPPNADNTYLAFQARDNGVGVVEVSRLQGAADPYFQATLPMRLLPVATASLPATPLEGMIAYDDTKKNPVYRTATAWNDMPAVYHDIAMSAHHHAGGADAWEDWDISALVPAGAKAVQVFMRININGAVCGVRNNGSALDTRYINNGETPMQIAFLSQCDANRVVEVYDDDAALGTEFSVNGYWS